MKIYKLTVFDKSGEMLLNDSVEAQSDQEAKEKAEKILSEKEYLNHTHRCTSPTGKLVLFHV